MAIKRILSALLLVYLVLSGSSANPGSAGLEAYNSPNSISTPSMYRLGDEVQLSPDGDGERYQPAIAFNYQQSEYLVVWHNTWPGGGRDIYARRVSDTGQVLSWFCVTTGTAKRSNPAVAYNSMNNAYLVVWMQEASANVYEIWGRIIPWNGPGTNADFQIISWANRSFWLPRVAWNPLHNEYMVVWNAFDTTASFPPGLPSDIGGYRVSVAGVVQNPGSPLVFTTYANPHQVDMTYNVAYDEYFLVFVVVHTSATTGNDIYGLRVSWNGTSVSPPGLIHIHDEGKNQNAPAVATNEQDRYMVVWEHEYNSSDHDIYGREYNVDGSPVTSEFTIVSWIEDTTAPDVAANGQGKEWLAVWQHDLGGGSGFAIKGFRWGSYPSTYTYFFDVANFVFWENMSPAVAADIPGYLIAYEGDSSITNRHIFGRMWWPQALYLPRIVR
ncbi:MAG: hypothetical protein JXB15_18010 [Anaerolineales bacterium]|nr:hypothetical protein [Anaerolineales bacterium]